MNNFVYNNSSVCKKVFKFLLGGRTENCNSREWKEMYNCQIKKGNYTDSPFLVVTAALLNEIMPIAIGQQWSRYKPKTTRSVNADETVRQVSKIIASDNDRNFPS